MTALAPENGVRVLLELARAEDDVAIYRVELHAPDAAWHCEARIDPRGVAIGEPAPLSSAAPSPAAEAGGRPTGGGPAGAPEPWMIESARAFLRTLHKNHVAARDWPRRQLRWRERR
jgi:hypothetical protein